MKRLSTKTKLYHYAVAWIAGNDEPNDLCVDTIKEQVTVCLVADMFGLFPEQVANDVWSVRWNEELVALRKQGIATMIAGGKNHEA